MLRSSGCFSRLHTNHTNNGAYRTKPWSNSRSYVFLPASWQELRTNLETWLGKRAKQRTIWVKLLRDRYNRTTEGRNNANANANPNAMAVSSSTRLHDYHRPSRYRAGRHWWRQRRGVWMNKVRSRLLPVPVHLTEYSKPHWFDSNGYPKTARDESGRFVNPWSSQSTNGSHPMLEFITWRLERLKVWTKRDTVPMKPVPWEPHDNISNNHDHLSLTWIGHSTCLVRLSGYILLTDPMFSHRASPVQWLPLGVPRHVPPACHVHELPSVIDVVLLSHDHYDHLDKTSCRALKDRVLLWAVPLNIQQWLVDKCDIDATKIVALEWWQQHHVQLMDDNDLRPPLTVTCAPAQHWGSRSMWDRNYRLWCSWAVSTPQRKFYFAGDTGYPTNEYPLFWQIGDALGPFDLAAIPIGAYAPRFFMKDSHVNPTEAVKIHEQVRSSKSVAIHWGTFALAEEDDDEPPQLLQEAVGDSVNFTAIQPGETLCADPITEETRQRRNIAPVKRVK